MAYGNQRPAAPWSFNNGWGQYATAGQLPNVTGARLQLPDVQAGDIAWVVDSGALYVCQVPTMGAAVWEQWTPSVVTLPTDLYLATNAPTANDAGPATIAEPLATLDEALRRIQNYALINEPVTLHIGSGSYAWTRVIAGITLRAPLTFYGDGAGQAGDDGFTELLASTAAGAGSSEFVVQVGAATFPVDGSWRGKTLEILTGAAAGSRRTIRDNTDTTITPCIQFDAAVANGDLFRVVESAIKIQPPLSAGGVTPTLLFAGVGTVYGDFRTAQTWNNFSATPNPETVFLANLMFEHSGATFQSYGFADSQVLCAGVEFTSTQAVSWVCNTGALQGGCDDAAVPVFSFIFFRLPAELGFTPGAKDWVGWGIAALGAPTASASMASATRLEGVFVYVQQSNTGATLASVTWRLLAGALVGLGASNFNGSFRFVDKCRIAIKSVSTDIRFLVTAVGGDARAAAIRAEGGSDIVLENTRVVLSGAGNALVASASEATNYPDKTPGIISVNAGVEISGPAACVCATYGGQIRYRDVPTVLTVPSVAECVITQNSTSAVGPNFRNSTPFAGLVDGAVIVNPTQADGSMIMRVV